VGHDIFISYAANDKPTADAACVALEANGVRCWVAPRDIVPGMDWGEAIVNAINECQIMVLVFSSVANESPQIKREVERAAHRGIPIIPFRIQDVSPCKSLEYFISTPHWLDALTPPMEKHLQYLVKSVKVLLHKSVDGGVADINWREPPNLITPGAAGACDQYRAAIEIAWANKKLEEAEVAGLEKLVAKIGLGEQEAAGIEIDIMGETKENIVERQRKSGLDNKSGATTQYNFCNKCGERLVAGAKFCKKCGQKCT
jgi:TIR domain